MKLLNKSLLILAILTAYVNMIFLLNWPISVGAFRDSLFTGDFSLIFILALGVGSFLAGLLLLKLKPLWLMVGGFLCAFLSLGGYTYAVELNQLITLRVLHGVALSLAFTSSLYCLFSSFQDFIGLLYKALIVASIFLIPVRESIIEGNSQWLIFISIFVTVFTGTLVAILSRYINNHMETSKIKTSIAQTSNISNILNGFLGSIIASLTLGVFLYTFNNLSISQQSLTGLPFYLFLFTMLISFSSEIAYISKYIGDAKSLCIGMLLLALNLSLITILKETSFIIIPVIFSAVAFSIILSTSFYCISNTGYKGISLYLGLLLALFFMSLLAGYKVAEYNYNEVYSPLIVSSIIIISASILFIRRIHQGSQIEL
ncbi:hypothetical protein [Alkaliphilus serpentinus]|uniref:MFS transporter n=1 Tax=Alkaliphilus serpentinus TaxID=1482731 RepID=A0A833HP88_9FIRM|nr:hypothetical protein [Alkaliphilus serpentinus]KAB3530459.1 hypothetical protein F8153_07025 [Alkaliphilus serpentinus]